MHRNKSMKPVPRIGYEIVLPFGCVSACKIGHRSTRLSVGVFSACAVIWKQYIDAIKVSPLGSPLSIA